MIAFNSNVGFIFMAAVVALLVGNISAFEKTDFVRNPREKARARAAAAAMSANKNNTTSGQIDEIIGGEVYPPGTREYLVALGFDFGFDDAYEGQFCAGTLISPNAVLTAAHCLSCLALGTRSPSFQPTSDIPTSSPTYEFPTFEPFPTSSPTYEFPTFEPFPTFSPTNG